MLPESSAAHAAEAARCLGGNGFVEDSGLPLLYRDAPLMSIWEGSGNVAALDALRALRAEFRAFFVACAAGDGEDAAAQLNALLIQHPVHPQLSGHDGQSWHVHYTESGSVQDKYAAGAVMGLAVRLTDVGI